MTWLSDKGKDARRDRSLEEVPGIPAQIRREEGRRGQGGKSGPRQRSALDYDPDLRWEQERRDPLVRADSVEIKNLAFRMTDRSAKSPGVPAITSVTAEGAQLSTSPG